MAHNPDPPRTRMLNSIPTAPGESPSAHLFFFNDPATTESYTSVNTLSLHDALPICQAGRIPAVGRARRAARQLGDLFKCQRSEEHTSELQSLTDISYAVFCLKK